MFPTMNRLLPLIVLCLVVIRNSDAQTVRTEHVLGLDEGAQSPPAVLEDMAWLAGAWTGEGFGGTIEEVWTPPSNGSMAGLFKLAHDGKPSIYEIQTITVENGSLVWKVKHFGGDFVAWEERDGFVAFPLVKMEPAAAYFDGMTLIRDGEKLVVYLIVSHGGDVQEERLEYRSVALNQGGGISPRDPLPSVKP